MRSPFLGRALWFGGLVTLVSLALFGTNGPRRDLALDSPAGGRVLNWVKNPYERESGRKSMRSDSEVSAQSYFLRVSTTVVDGCRRAVLTGINRPVRASRPICVLFAIDSHLLPLRSTFDPTLSRTNPNMPRPSIKRLSFGERQGLRRAS
jgi:hypothetical protein